MLIIKPYQYVEPVLMKVVVLISINGGVTKDLLIGTNDQIEREAINQAKALGCQWHIEHCPTLSLNTVDLREFNLIKVLTL